MNLETLLVIDPRQKRSGMTVWGYCSGMMLWVILLGNDNMSVGANLFAQKGLYTGICSNKFEPTNDE